MWISCGDGVVRFDGLTWSGLDEEDGLPSLGVERIAQDGTGAMWFTGNHELVRYRPVHASLPAPTVSVQLDQLYLDVSQLPKVLEGRLMTFKCAAVEFRTRPARRLHRYAIVPGHQASAPAKADPVWLAPDSSPQFAWRTDNPGAYTFFAQVIDRDLNYSAPAAVQSPRTVCQAVFSEMNRTLPSAIEACTPPTWKLNGSSLGPQLFVFQ